jgi:1-acyl-sn-glycerol-3-phosphate acyltransferase
MNANPPVPAFGVGQTSEPLAYLHTNLPPLGMRLGLDGFALGEFVGTGITSAEACIPLMSQDALLQGVVEAVPEARAFWNLVGAIAVSQDSTVSGIEHFIEAQRLKQEGFNVVLVQNHRSGADTLIMETLLHRTLKHDVCADWSYMAGHVVNLYLIPLMFVAAFRRFQIFSMKYQSTGVAGLDAQGMKQQNIRAMRALRRHTAGGGTFTTYYPEGGRGTGGMMKGEAQTSCILHNIANSGKPLIILPTNIANSEQLLPQARGPNEFNEVIQNMSLGTAHLSIGAPVTWGELLDASSGSDDTDQYMCDTLLSLVAQLGPTAETGYYSPEHAFVQDILSKFPRGGVLA